MPKPEDLIPLPEGMRALQEPQIDESYAGINVPRPGIVAMLQPASQAEAPAPSSFVRCPLPGEYIFHKLSNNTDVVVRDARGDYAIQVYAGTMVSQRIAKCLGVLLHPYGETTYSIEAESELRCEVKRVGGGDKDTDPWLWERV